MLERCQPPVGTVDPPLHLLNYTICTSDPLSFDMIDGFKSFPSGHSSCKDKRNVIQKKKKKKQMADSI